VVAVEAVEAVEATGLARGVLAEGQEDQEDRVVLESEDLAETEEALEEDFVQTAEEALVAVAADPAADLAAQL